MTYKVTDHSPLYRLCQDVYPSIKMQYPSEGRRKWRLRVAEHFWALEPEKKAVLAAAESEIPLESRIVTDFVTDMDPFDKDSKDTPEIGILVRTDYSDEDAWQTFHSKLQDAEKEFTAEDVSEENKMTEDEPSDSFHSNHASDPSSQSTAIEGDAMEEDEESSSEDEDQPPIFKIINPSTPDQRATLSLASNLSALRLLNDVNIQRAPSPPAGTKRIKPPNRLVDHDGWQEAYSGKTLWIYDTKSNSDQCVRLINQQGSNVYGTATGDSWRARVSHICELQVNLYSGAMKIDFGGLDRWDYSERQRNIQEANLPIA